MSCIRYVQLQILKKSFFCCYMTLLFAYNTIILTSVIFMPPTLKKLSGHIALDLSVRPFVRTKVKLSSGF